jgi:aspartyl/glutamyl-tRNA(Asn/Gln) amidotransferase C subunit
MTEEITPDLFEKLGNLAMLDFDEKEAEYLRMELNHQIKAICILESIVVEKDMPQDVHGVTFCQEYRLPLRADVWIPFDNPDEILAQAPRVEDGYIVVPDISHTDRD